MRFVEAFRRLGYTLTDAQQSWSARSDTGVCLTLWKRETQFPALVMDTRLHSGPIADWGDRRGNARRIAHAGEALDRHGGWVDAVMLDGVPGEGYGNATPWDVAARKRRWRVTFLDRETGHLRVEAFAPL